jgi:hypothetical protein
MRGSWTPAGEGFRGDGRLYQFGRLIPVAVIGLALVLGLVLGRVTAPTAPEQVRTVALPPGASRLEAGVPVGYQRTPDGAVNAATAYAVTFSGPLLLRPDELRAAQEAVVAPEYREEFESRGAQTLKAFQAAYGITANAAIGARPVLELIPIAYKLEVYDGLQARVDIWAVWLVAEEGLLAPQQNWITSQLTLRWVDGDWKVAASGGHPGPVPQPPQGAVPEQSSPLPATLTDYREYRHVSP